MKKIYFLLLLISTGLMAQIPQGFSYQAVALNSAGNAVASAPVKIRISILESSATGSASYVETHNPTTNNLGLFTLTIGMGTPVTGTFSTVNWAQNSKFLKVEIDVTNGTNYITVGSSQLLSVPYAMYAGAVAGFGGSVPTGVLSDLFLYGTFNSFNTATALQLTSYFSAGFHGFKYLTAGSQVKFITALNSSAAYGNVGQNILGLNGSAFTINSNGMYRIFAENGYGDEGNDYKVYITSISPTVHTGFSTSIPMTYNAATNTLSCVVNIPSGIETQYRNFVFNLTDYDYYGDNLANGSLDLSGTSINFPSTGAGNFLVTLNLNFTGDGSPYTVTQQ